MKKFFIVVVLAFLTAITSCQNDDDEIIVNINPTELVHDTVEVIRDTVVGVDTIVEDRSLDQMYWFDIAKITDYYLDIGKAFSETDDYEDYVNRHGGLPVHEYLTWLGYATVDYGWRRRWQQYSIQKESEKVLPRNYQRLATFEEDVVFPARAYVQKLKDMGYGGSHYTSWIDPGDFLREAIKNYHGKDSYGYTIIVEEVANANFIFGI